MITFLKIILVIIMLAAMVILICGIGHIFSGDFNTDEEANRRLRDDLRDRDEIITRENVFHAFLDTEYVRHNDGRKR